MGATSLAGYIGVFQALPIRQQHIIHGSNLGIEITTKDDMTMLLGRDDGAAQAGHATK